MDLFPSKWLSWIFRDIFYLFRHSSIQSKERSSNVIIHVHAAYCLTSACLLFSKSPVSFLQRQETILSSKPEQSASKPPFSLLNVEKAFASQTSTSCLLKPWSPFTLKSHPCISAVNIFNETAEGQGAAMLKDFYMATWPSTSNDLLPPLSFLRPCITVTGCSPLDEVLRAP